MNLNLKGRIMNKVLSFCIILLNLFVSVSISQTKEFTIAYSGTYPKWDPATNSANWFFYDELRMNLWQGWGIGEANSHGFILDSLAAHNISGYFQPDTLMQYAFGKVVIHQAEENTQDSFRYRNHFLGEDITETFMGETVTARFFDVNTVPPGERGTSVPVLTGVRENAVHSFSGLVLDPKFQAFWDTIVGQHRNSWYVKPRMRINIADTAGPSRKVIKIIVRAFNGDVILAQDITTQDFRINSYNGKYLEDYFSNGISVPGDKTSIGLNKGFPFGLDHRNKIGYFDSCKVDFEIHWYRDVSFWIDYVKIMDEPAYLLFNPNKDIRNAIKRQIQRLINHSGGNRIKGFYTEEIEYTNLRCAQFIQDSIILYAVSNESVRMNCLLNPWSFQHNLRSIDSASRYDEYLDKVKPSKLIFAFYAEQGQFGDYRNPLPNNIDSFYFPPDQPFDVKQKVFN
jgi:hypothetical protein